MVIREPGPTSRAIFPLTGGVCPAATAALAERLLLAQPGVRHAYGNPATECAYVEYDTGTTDPERLVVALESADLVNRPPSTAGRWTALRPLALSAAGLAIVGTSLYLLSLHAGILPEVGSLARALPAPTEAAESVITRAVWAFGGIAIATGILTLWLAWAGPPRSVSDAGVPSAFAGAVALGLMVAVATVRGSQYGWALVGLALLAVAVVLFAAYSGRESEHQRCTQ